MSDKTHCPKCGSALDTGFNCPNCGYKRYEQQESIQPKPTTAEKRRNKMNEMKKVLILLALCLLITLCACKANSDKKTPQAWCVNAVIEDIGNLDNYILWVSESGNQTPESESNCGMYIIEIYDINTDFYYKYATSISFKQTTRGATAKAFNDFNGIDKDTTSVNKITESDILDLDVELIYTNKINE